MRLPATILATLALLVSGAAALAQDDSSAMTVQRCIWRCQASNPEWAAYEGCVAKICTVRVDSPDDDIRELALREAAAARQSRGRWRYGFHPVLGESAHIDTADGAIGLACTYEPAGSLALRATRNVADEVGLTLMLEPGLHAGRFDYAEAGAYVEQRAGACDIPVGSFMRGGSAFLVRARITGIQHLGGDATRTTMESGARQVDVLSATEAAEAFGAASFPLAGSSKAIGALLAACEAARAELSAGCGSGD